MTKAGKAIEQAIRSKKDPQTEENRVKFQVVASLVKAFFDIGLCLVVFWIYNIKFQVGWTKIS